MNYVDIYSLFRDYIPLDYYFEGFMDFGKAVSMAIAGERLDYKVVATKLDISTNYLYDIATNRKNPGLNLLINLSKLCKIKLSTLIQYGES